MTTFKAFQNPFLCNSSGNATICRPMSVLFEALSRASREDRRVDDPVVIPVVPLHPVRSYVPSLYLLSLLAAALLGGVCVYLVRDQAPVGSVVPAAAPLLAAAVSSAQPPVQPPAQPEDSSEGIALATQAPGDKEDSENVSAPFAVPAVSDDEVQQASKSRVEGSARSPVVVDTVDPLQPAVQTADELRRASQAMQLRDWGAALTLFDRVLKRKPDQVQALDGKIFVLEQIGNAGALAQVEALVRAHPAKASLRASQARLLSSMGHETEALAAWEEAVAFEPANPSYGLGLAISHDRLGHVDQALAGYRATPARELTPEIRRRVAYLEEQMRQYEAVLAASNVGRGKD